jgi:hypothetical protein
VLKPPRDRPIAWSSPAFFRAGAVLMRAHDGAVDHRVFVVGVGREMQKDPLPDSRPGPAMNRRMQRADICHSRLGADLALDVAIWTHQTARTAFSI